MEQPLQLSLNLCPGAREKKRVEKTKQNEKLGVEREKESGEEKRKSTNSQ